MIVSLNKSLLFSTFGVDDFDNLEQVIGSMAPSMVEYYLSDLSNSNDDTYLNKRNVQETISVGDYSLYLDYDDEVYLEISDDNSVVDDYETPSLW